LARRLDEVYRRKGQPPQLALAIAEMLGPDKGRAVLRAHVAAKPGDRGVFEQLVRQSVAPAAGKGAPLADAVEAYVAAVAAKPETAREYAGYLVDAAPNQDALLAAVPAVPLDPKSQAIGAYLKGRSLLKSGRIDDAMKAFDQAAGGEHHLPTARV